MKRSKEQSYSRCVYCGCVYKIDQLTNCCNGCYEKYLSKTDSVDTIIEQKDTEIERLMGALREIYDVPNQTTIKYAVETVLEMQEIARNALEVSHEK